MKMQQLHLCSALSALIAAALHGGSQLIRAAEGTDKQGYQNGNQGSGPIHQAAVLKIRPPRLLSRHNFVRFLNQSGNKPKGNTHHHGKLMHRHMQSLQGAHQRFQSIGQRNGRSGVSQQKGAADQHQNPHNHKRSPLYTAGGDYNSQNLKQDLPFPVEKQVQNAGKYQDHGKGLHSPDNGLPGNLRNPNGCQQQKQQKAIANPAFCAEQRNDIGQQCQQLRSGIQPVNR